MSGNLTACPCEIGKPITCSITKLQIFCDMTKYFNMFLICFHRSTRSTPLSPKIAVRLLTALCAVSV